MTHPKNIIHTLTETPLDSWNFILDEAIYSEKFSEWKAVAEWKPEFEVWIQYFLNRIRIQTGENSHHSFHVFIYALKKRIDTSKIEDIRAMKTLVSNLYYKKINLAQARKFVENEPIDSWETLLKQLQQDIDTTPKTIQDHTDSMSNRDIDNITSLISNLQIKAIKNIAEEAYFIFETDLIESTPFNRDALVTKLVRDLLDSHEYQANKNKYLKKNTAKVAHILAMAWWKSTGYQQKIHPSQMLALICFTQSDDKGLLEQIRTGEGKTLITGLFAAYKALAGEAVDVVTSNRDLAEAGCSKCQSFFNLFNLEAKLNCTKDEDTNKQAISSSNCVWRCSLFSKPYIAR